MKSPPIDMAKARMQHVDAQSRPHPLEGSRPYPIRAEARGLLVAQLFLSLDVAQPRNRSRGSRQPWQGALERTRALTALSAQWRSGSERVFPLAGRPLVRCIRYSSSEPDTTAGWSKVPVDCLQPSGVRNVSKTVTHPYGHKVQVSRQVPYRGLGIISSDSPRVTDVVEWWEPAKRGEGFVVIEVWTGEKA